jgi:hypothetical protein
MEEELEKKVAQLEAQKSNAQAIELLRTEALKHKNDEKWLEAALLRMTDLLVYSIPSFPTI